MTMGIELLCIAERTIIKLVQQVHYEEDIRSINANVAISKSSSLEKLDPFMDKDKVLRVGGRLKKSSLNEETMHPIIIPKGEVAKMIIRMAHQCVAHGGRGYTIHEVRRRGYWIVRCNTLVRSVINNCVTCKKLRGSTAQQKMADLPADRLEVSAPFTNCGVDLFGPFIIKEGRRELKRYGTLFTCLVSRAIHIESANSLETDSFILALRRFVSRRGNIRLLRADNGTNFVGAEAELRRAWNEMDQQRISTYLQQQGGDLIKWKRNPPKASHFGGIWERQIRSARAIMTSLLATHGESLNDESYRTVLTEVENIVNSRPLTSDFGDINSDLSLSPINLLTMKSKVVLPPPGIFQHSDMYSRRRWRRVQHIANEFWQRWRKEYIQNLQKRTKWSTERANLDINDVVMIKDDDLKRNDWKLARITNVCKGADGKVRSVELLTANKTELTRPIHKLILLEKYKNENR